MLADLRTAEHAAPSSKHMLLDLATGIAAAAGSGIAGRVPTTAGFPTARPVPATYHTLLEPPEDAAPLKI